VAKRKPNWNATKFQSGESLLVQLSNIIKRRYLSDPTAVLLTEVLVR